MSGACPGDPKSREVEALIRAGYDGGEVLSSIKGRITIESIRKIRCRWQVNSLEAHAGVWMDSSEELIAGVRRGDENAFQLIFEQHHRFVFRFLYGMVGEHRLAEELTQETFMRAYKNIETVREKAKLLSWICGIARHPAVAHTSRAIAGR